MTELESLLTALEAHEGAVLATLLTVEGSAYRGPGARMLSLGDGGSVGAISGGCLEKDVIANAEQVRAAGKPRVVTYDLTRDDDKPWGLGLGCNARLEVLLEPCRGAPVYLRHAVAAARARHEAVLATRYVGVPVGARLLVVRDAVLGDRSEGELAAGDPETGNRVRETAERVLASGVSTVEDGVFYEFLPRPIALVACGDGPDVAPLLRVGAQLGWHARGVAQDQPTGMLDDRTAAVVMTHNYGRDLALLRELLASDAAYVGLLGPKSRADRLIADLKSGGFEPSRAQLARLHAPVGLDIGAEGPAEVALAIAAEVRAAFARREGGMLRERQGPIHDRQP